MSVLFPTDSVRKVESIFLAGTIDMGNSEDWQRKVSFALLDSTENVVIYNPRRPDWDANWTQSMYNKEFNHQVNWELKSLRKSDLIFLYFAPGSKSPITLLELGINLDKNRIIVCCPKGFERKGNVDIVCHNEGILLFDDLDQMIEHTKTLLTETY